MLGAGGSYKYNTANSEGFRFGDTWTINLLVVRRFEWDKLSLAPYVQVSHESLLRDADRHVLQAHSGGTACYAGGGFDLNTKRFTFGIDAQFAAGQSLASGQITAGPRLSARSSISF
ncbi:MAG: hypothetical protein EOP50_08350 [Sphingobacteriales bacterium]|nr:MAG: hypothetical protein EOP50_08350 [Sphingobacteriales bacterium]